MGKVVIMDDPKVINKLVFDHLQSNVSKKIADEFAESVGKKNIQKKLDGVPSIINMVTELIKTNRMPSKRCEIGIANGKRKVEETNGHAPQAKKQKQGSVDSNDSDDSDESSDEEEEKKPAPAPVLNGKKKEDSSSDDDDSSDEEEKKAAPVPQQNGVAKKEESSSDDDSSDEDEEVPKVENKAAPATVKKKNLLQTKILVM